MENTRKRSLSESVDNVVIPTPEKSSYFDDFHINDANKYNQSEEICDHIITYRYDYTGGTPVKQYRIFDNVLQSESLTDSSVYNIYNSARKVIMWDADFKLAEDRDAFVIYECIVGLIQRHKSAYEKRCALMLEKIARDGNVTTTLCTCAQ